MHSSTFIAPNVMTPFGERQMPIRFGVPSDAEALKSWKAGRGHSFPSAARDAIEYAKLASKRWRYYARRDEVATTLDQLQSRVAERRNDEVGFLLVAESTWANAPGTMAMA